MQNDFSEGEKIIMSSKLSTDDKREVLSDFKFEKKKENFSKAQEAVIEQRENINLWTNKLKDPKANGWIEEAEYETIVKKLSGDETKGKQKLWSDIYDKQAAEEIDETDSKTFLKLEQRIFDYWNNENESSIDDIQTELAYAYKVGGTYNLEKKKPEGDGRITTADYNELLSRLDADLPKAQRQFMQDIIQETKHKLRQKGVGVLGFDYLDEKESKQLTESNRALYEWTKNQVEAGKLPTKSEMLEQKLNLDLSIENKDLPIVTTDEDYKKLKSGDVFIGDDGKKYMKP
jgi:hypothetical protein